ncbi:MAG: LysR family transcriptional regulator [Saprospiraceae bacterium]|nr:LysR family transcriptional regulator [Saprospiraceae bacterium]
MKIQQLEYFIALAARGNFGEAAQLCHVSQPAMSMAIKTFEEKLGERLFIRHGNPIILSPFGEKVLPHARRIVFEYQSLLSLSDEVDALSGDLRIGVIPTIAPYLLPKLITRLRKLLPDTTLVIEEQLTAIVLDKINCNELDVGIVATPIEANNLHETFLYREPFMLYGAHEPKNKYILPEDIDVSELWILQEGHCLRDQIADLCALQKQQPHEIQYQAGSIETLMNLVDQYGGLTIVPELAAKRLSPSRSKRLQLFKKPAPAREVSLVYHPLSIKLELLERLGAIIKRIVPEYDDEGNIYRTVPVRKQTL